MSKEEENGAIDQSTVVPDTDSSPGADQAPPTDGFEAPKRPRTVAQIAAFEKARAARAAKQAARKTKEPEERSVSPPLPSRREEPEPVKIATATPTPVRRKPRSDAGKRRGRLVRYEEESEEQAADPPELPPYFTIV